MKGVSTELTELYRIFLGSKLWAMNQSTGRDMAAFQAAGSWDARRRPLAWAKESRAVGLSGSDALGDETFDCGGEWFAKFFEQTAAGSLRKVQLFGCGVNEPASGLKAVTEESLAQRHRVKRER